MSHFMPAIPAVPLQPPAARATLLHRVCRISALLLLTLPAAGLYASTFTVTVFTDANAGAGGSGSGNSGDLRWAINQADLVSGSTVDFSCASAPCTITLSGPLPPITTDMTIDGGSLGAIVIDGANAYRVFFVDTGAVTIENLQIQNANATGGGGGNGISPGGGGAGFGAGLFVNQSTAAVTVQNVYFYNCNATGGTGGAALSADQSGGGGGGLGGGGGGGGASTTTGGGGGGVVGSGQTGDASGNGGAGGGGGGGSTSTDGTGGIAYATGNAGSNANGDVGGAGGFGGGGGGGDFSDSGIGGAGGFGGGGGGGGNSALGGAGGFGGGGGGAPAAGSSGASAPAVGGASGGSGGASTGTGTGGGGGGAAAGPAIFVNQGSLTLQNSTASNFSATAGSGGAGVSGGSSGSSGTAATGILLSNYPYTTDALDAAFSLSQAYAFGFTMTETTQLNSVIMRIRTGTSAPIGDLTVALFSDNSGVPGSSLQALSLSSPSFAASSTHDYTFVPTSSVTLNSGTTYWIFIQWTGGISIYLPCATFPATTQYTMSGATYLGTEFSNPYPNPWAAQNLGGLPATPYMQVNVGAPSAVFSYAGTVNSTATAGAWPLSDSMPATHFSVSAPSSFQGRTSQTVTVAALDVNGNAATGYSGTVNLTSTNAGASFTSNPITLSGGTGSTTFSMSTVGSGFTITATDANESSITGTSGGIDVTVGPFSKLAVSAPATATAGTSFTFTVTAEDSDGNTITPFADTIAFSSGDGAAVLPANSTLVNGTGAFSATLNTGGSQTLTATDSAKSISGQASITVSVPTWLVVNTTADDAGTAGNCHAQSGPNTNTTDISPRCSLRDALLNAAGQTLSNISFDSAVFASANTVAANTITTDGITMTIPSNTQINGPLTPTGVTVDGAQSSAIFATASNSVGVGISGLTIADGLTTPASHSNGGAGIQNNGALTLTDCTFYNDQALNGFGGAIQLTNASTLSVTGSTFTGNGAIQGGAIFDGGATSISVNESTFYNNNVGSTGEGGAVFINNATTSVAGSTFADNSALNGGAIYTHGTGTLSLENNIFTANSASSVGGAVENGEVAAATANYNLFFNNTAGSSGPDCDNCGTNTNEVTADPKLTALNTYVGPTQTMVPQPGSAAICAGSAALIPAGQATDQRGYPFHPTGGYCSSSAVDLGSVQTNYAMSFTINPPSTGTVTGTAMSPAPQVTLTESGATFTPGSASISLTDLNSDLTTTPATASTTSGVASFSSLIFSGATSGDMLDATLALNPAASPAPSISATSSAFGVTLGPSQLVVNGSSSATAGSAFTLTATAKDSSGDVVTSYAGTVSVAIATGPSGATFAPSSTLTAICTSGVCTFSNLVLDTAGAYTITATDAGNPSLTGTSGTVTVSASATPAKIIVSGFPASVYASIPATGSVIVADQFGNTESGYSASATLMISDTSGTVSSPVIITNGTGTFSATFATLGPQSITASITDSGLTSVPENIAVSPVPSYIVAVTSDDLATVSGGNCVNQNTGLSSTNSSINTSCTLRDAVTAADAATAGSITFDPTVFASLQTISPQDMIYSDAADSINPTAYIWITAPASGVKVDGGSMTSTDPLLSFGMGRVVSLSGLQLTDSLGAGLKVVENANVTVSGSTFSGNALGIDAEDPGFDGLVPTVTVSNSTFSNNSNPNLGGAIYATDASVTVSNSTLSGNQANLGGAAYVSDGSLIIQNSSLTNNTAAQYGGALFITQSGGTSMLTVNGSTINGNQVSIAGSGGGGIWLDAGTAAITDSTINGNVANGGGGGGLFVNSGTANIEYTTIAGNTSAANGGAINSGGTVTLTNVTVYGNTAGTFAGGIDNENASTAFTLANTIVAENSATGTDPNGINGFTSGGHNLIGDPTGMTGFADGDDGDHVGSSINPLLSPLGNYGGPTQTMTPLPGSPVIGAGDPTKIGTVTTDQRGDPAIVGGSVDIGAVESQRFTLVATSGTPQSAHVSQSFSLPLIVTVTANNAAEPVAGGAVTFSAPGSGASATLGGSTETIGTNGQASDSATANATGGSYTVKASASGAPTSASFSLINAGSPAALISPAPNSVLTGPRVAFIWSAAAGATAYKLWIGTSAGKNDLYTSGSITATNATPSLATNGETLYVTLVTFYGSIQEEAHYIYTAATPAAMTSPAASSVLAGPDVLFTWSAAPGAAAYKLWIGTSAGKNDLYTSGPYKATSATAVGLPVNGETVYATLVTIYDSYLAYAHYTFTAATEAALSSPTPSTVLAGPEVPFVWSTAPNATGYKLWVGTSASEQDLYSSGAVTTTTATPLNLPTNGETLYVTLVTLYGSNQVYAHYAFTAATEAALSSPTPSTQLAGASVPFTWSAAPGATAYKLWIGSSAGKNDLYTSGTITLTDATPTKLPTNGQPVYVTLVTVYGTRQAYAHYTFTAASSAH